jgi:hypothetical protein
VSWGEFLVRFEIDEVCPANDYESFSVIVAGNCTSELFAFTNGTGILVLLAKPV